jgi:ketosteroid isomerase-like protein
VRTRLMAITVLALMLALPGTLLAQESDPEALVRSLYEALNTGDIDAALAFYADDAVESLGDFGTFSGKEELRSSFEVEVARNATWELENFQVEGDSVTFTNRYTNNNLRALGVTLEGIEVITIQDGKITTDTWTATEESLAALQAAMAALPPQAMPVTGGTAVPLYPVVAVFGGLMCIGGLGLGVLRWHRRQTG